jgi:hypothetical protein
MLKRTVVDKDGNLLEDLKLEAPINVEGKDKKETKRKNSKTPKQSK